ncbi:helix-turn-helix domain-containing protein [Kitasatospora sp. NPDC096147]|uniref:helix-turn-helix domain-containing protein n=1 Tax=Kitasatospora sp. NPDC096147 TaxID=3364093 RepID=UPI00381EDD45
MTTATPVALTVQEVMAALRLGRSTVFDLLRSGALPSFTIGRARRIDPDDLATYIRTQPRSTPQ